MSGLEPCLVGLEACGGAHHWARLLCSMGHDARLMSPQFVKAYVKSNKNDFRDAEAICEAVSRPTMRFVPVKSVQQQDLQHLHRIRSQAVAHRTALSNQIRGFLLEYGVVIAQGLGSLRRRLPEILEDADNGLSGAMRNPRALVWRVPYTSPERAIVGSYGMSNLATEVANHASFTISIRHHYYLFRMGSTPRRTNRDTVSRRIAAVEEILGRIAADWCP